jgi:tight adherence protein C
MLIIALAVLVLIGFSVTVLLRTVGQGRVRAAQTLDQIGDYGFAGAGRGTIAEPSSAAARPSLDGIASSIGNALGSRLGTLREAEIRRRLVAAGLFTVSPRKFVGYQVLATVGLPLILAWLVAAGSPSGLLLALSLTVGAACGWFLPLTYLRQRAQARLEEIESSLPELIDLLVVTVEAGLGFSGSLQLAGKRIGGALGQELRLTLQEQTMGLSTTEALRNLLERADTPALRRFVRGVTQGEQLGVSIGQIMRNLAVEIRKMKRQQAEERAQKAPVKILFPLIFLIFPAMFVILLAPAVYAFVQALGGS